MHKSSQFRPGFRRAETDDLGGASTEMDDVHADAKNPSVGARDVSYDKSQQHLSDVPDEDAQRGVRMVEGITLSWTRNSLIWVFIKYAHTSHC